MGGRTCAGAAVFSGALLLAAGGAAAQTVSGTMQGTVTDSSGGVLPGATIALKNLETGQQRTVLTNEVGFYSAPFLSLAPYRVAATLAGFGTVVRERVEVTLNDTRTIDFRLDPKLTQEVTVTAEAPRINTTSQEIKGSLSDREIMDRPMLNAGSFLSLAETFAGYQENPTSGQNNPTLSSGSSINFNGTGTRGATFQINGVNNDDSSENQHRQGAAASTIKEFQVISNSYSAEFGRGYGAVVLVQTKSGANAIHGDVYEYRQQSRLNARTFFQPRSVAKPVRGRDEYGFTLGFPIRRNRLFGFVSADHTENNGQNGITRDFVLPAELTIPRLTRGNDTPENRAFIDSVLQRFPGHITNNDARSPRTFTTNVGFDWPDRDYSARADWQPNGGNHAFLRWQYTRQWRNNEEIIVGETTRQNNKQANVGLTWTRVFSSRLLGEFRYGLGKRSTHVDIKSGNDTPIIRFTGTPVAGTTIGSAGNLPIHRDQTDHQFVYNLTALRGSHSFKVGTDVRRQQLDDFADDFSRPFWTFNRVCAGVTYATPYHAFLDGCIAGFTKNFGPFFLENRINEYNVYAEDNWRIHPRLTLNLGLRYEYVQAPSEVKDRIDYVYGDDTNNVEPRLGVAWSPGWESGWLGRMAGGAGNASLRGGFGVYHGRIFQSVFSQGGASVRTNPPNALRTSWPHRLNVSDPTNGFVFVPGPQTQRHTLVLPSEDLEMPQTYQWNVTAERKIPFNSTVRVTYSGSRGTGLIKYTQDNLPVSPGAGGIVVVDHPNNAPAAGFPDLRGKRIDRVAADVLCAGTGLPGVTINDTCPNVVPIADNEISFRVARISERRPDPRYNTNTHISNGAETWYHGLQTEWIRRFSGGFYFTMNYTWSKSIDTTSEATSVGTGDSNANGPIARFARGHSRFHTPHRVTISGSYHLPFFRNRGDVLEAALGGWQLSGILKLASGTPFTVIDGGGRDLNFDGFSEGRPVVLDPSILGRSIDHPSTSQQQLPRSAFRTSTLQDFDGDILGRNTFYLDGTNNLDLVIQKNFRLAWSGRHTVQVRGEMFNALNQVQFGFPDVNLSNTNFGRITGTATLYSPRIVQLTLRYRF